MNRRELAALGVCLLAGLALALLPHLVAWQETGDPALIADADELLYLSVATRAYHDASGSLSDPIPAGGGPTVYPWIQLGPGALIARLLGWGPQLIPLAWRLLAGLSLPLAWYLLLRQYVRDPRLAGLLTILLLGDVGVVFGKLVIRHLPLAFDLATQDPGAVTRARVHSGWRLITPGLSLPVLLLHLAFLRRALQAPRWPRLVASGAAFGLLVHTYFYYWTAATLALALTWLLDPSSRRTLGHTAWIGGLLGLPAIASRALLKQSTAPDWLQRSDKFVPIERFSELMWPKVALLLLILLAVWGWRRRRRELIHPLCLAGAALLLLNHQLVTGLQIENWHWGYVYGPTLAFLSALLGASLLGRPGPALRLVLCLGVGAHLGLALWMRQVETVHAARTRAIQEAYHDYRAWRVPGPALTPRAVLAGPRELVPLAVLLDDLRPLDHYAVVFSPAVDNAEWDARIALDAYLQGTPRTAFAEAQAARLAREAWGPWAQGRNPALQAERLTSRVGAYDAVRADPTAALERFQLRYLARPASGPQPPAPWRLIAEGSRWTLWERPP